MAHLAIICPPLPGHINPMAVLARELSSRGHSVTFLGFPDMGAKLPDDLDFVPFAADEQPLGSLKPYLERLSHIGGMLRLRRVILDLARFSEITCRELPRVIEWLRPDALIIDQTDSAASLVARAIGLPFANVANALPLNREPAIPPPVLPWLYDPSSRGIRRNLGGYRVARFVEQPITQVIRRNARRFGLNDVRHPDETWSDKCQITQCVAALDFPREQLPPAFHYVGPLRETEARASIELPDDGRPLVFCSLGSLQGWRAHLFRAVAEAAADLDLNLLIAHGGLLSERQADDLPGKPLVRSFVPQRAVLGRSALAVTHAGFNTVMDALSCATPMVALPIAFEQPGTGARLERAGVGEVVPHGRTAKRIRRTMELVLGQDSYRTNALRLSREIAASGGVRQAADLIEESFGFSGPSAIPTRARSA